MQDSVAIRTLVAIKALMAATSAMVSITVFIRRRAGKPANKPRLQWETSSRTVTMLVVKGRVERPSAGIAVASHEELKCDPVSTPKLFLAVDWPKVSDFVFLKSKAGRVVKGVRLVELSKALIL